MTTYINDVREDNKPTRKVWRGYDKPCAVPYKWRASSGRPTYTSYVKSYRGPKMYVESCDGTDRIERFNDFAVLKLEYEYMETYFCHSNQNYNLWFEDMAINNLFTPGMVKGEVPPYQETDFGSIVSSEILDYIARDLYKKANSPRYNSTVAIAELFDTLTDIRDIFKGVLKLFVGAKTFADLIKHYSLNTEELWLWVRYGLIPAMKDVEDLIKALDDKWRPISRVKAGRKTTLRRTGDCYTGKWDGVNDLHFTWKLKAKLSGGGAMDVCAPKQWNDWGRTDWDQLIAAWQVIPFSFIADWFVQFSDWLESLRPTETTILQKYATGVIEGEVRFYPSTPGFHTVGVPKIKVFLMTRILDFEAPKYPLQEDSWRDVIHVVDAINLVVSLLKGKLNRR